VTVAAYHRELVARLAAILGERLLGVYAAGSFGLHDFDAGRSDLDVFAVASGDVTRDEKDAIVAALRHESLPCPARGLEFVLYPERTARVPTNEAGFVLNLNTGPSIAFRVDLEPGAVERHWFPIDRAILRASGTALYGPPPGEVFAEIPRPLLLPVVRESLLWYRTPGNAGDDDTVLTAARTLHWARTGRWPSKSEGGAWAVGHGPDPELVAAALADRSRRAELGRERVQAFVDAVLDDVSE
jgi:hypothetical protein